MNTWTFKDNLSGPKYWYKNYPKCIVDNIQSPINIDTNKLSECNKLCSLKLNYKNTKFNCKYDDNFITVYYDSNSSVIFNDIEYTLQKITFHLPSQHMVDGNEYPMEVNLHHKSNTSDKLIIAIFVTTYGKNYNSQNEFSKIIKNLPKNKNKRFYSKATWDVNNIIPKYNTFYNYNGSLPYPPCDRNFIYILYQNTVVISNDDYQVLKLKVYNNVRRPIASIGNRVIYYSNNNEKEREKKHKKQMRCRLVKGYHNIVSSKCKLKKINKLNTKDILYFGLFLWFIFIIFLALRTVRFLYENKFISGDDKFSGRIKLPLFLYTFIQILFFHSDYHKNKNSAPCH